MLQLEPQIFPILESAAEMDVLYPTHGDAPAVGEILLVGVHDCGDGEELFDSASCAKIRFKFFSNSLGGVLLDGLDYQGKELVPL